MKTETKEDLGLAWFAVKLGACLLVASYVFGPMPALAFLLGWLWGNWDKDKGSPDDVKLDDLP